MLIIVFLINFVIQLHFTTFIPIATPAARFYDVDLTAINWLALIWSASFLPATLLASWGMLKFGLRRMMIAAGGMMLLGSVVRALTGLFDEVEDEDDGIARKDSAGAYALLLIGSFLMGLVQPIVLSSTTLTAAAWFSEKQRNLANTLVRPLLPVDQALSLIHI